MISISNRCKYEVLFQFWIGTELNPNWYKFANPNPDPLWKTHELNWFQQQILSLRLSISILIIRQ
jgi:hypothetical protein